jgi:hypothetical protein
VSWLCICGIMNASANTHCAADRTPIFGNEHYQISPSTYDSSLYWVAEGRVKRLLMTPNEELHTRFFNDEAILVANMSDIELDEHIHELETIAREAKARIMAASEESRNRRGKSKVKEWLVTPAGPDQTVTDSLNRVKQRGARISKLDKMRDKLAALGIPDKEIDQMISKMVSQARKDNPSANPVNTGIVLETDREAAKALKAEQDKLEKEAEKAAKGKTQPVIESITSTVPDIPVSKPFDISSLSLKK